MIKIAFSGVFDLKNYGDHLFYILFEKMLSYKGIEFEMDLFSTFEFEQDFYESRKVYALRDMEKMHNIRHYDALIVGGGGIINLLYSEQRISGDTFERYSFSDLWVIPSMLAAKYGIKCIWNSPEVPNYFPDVMGDMVQCIVREIDYISVRDEKSKDILVSCGVPKQHINVVPDTALIINQYFDVRELKKCVKALFGFDDRYIVFHCNRWIPYESCQELDRIFFDAKNRGYEVVFLPLAYTHADDEALCQVADKIGTKVIIPDKRLSVYEMLAVLAVSHLYLGVSFHGAVTALQYHKRALAYDYMHNKKTKALFSLFGKQTDYIEDYDKLYAAYADLISLQEYEVANQENERRIEEHFNRIIETIGTDKNVEKYNFIFDITRAIEKVNMEFMSDENKLNKDQAEIDNLKKELLSYNELVNFYKEKSNGFEKELGSAQELLKCCALKELELAENIESLNEKNLKLEKELSIKQSRIDAMESTRVWKCRNRVRKILRKDK